MASPISNTYTEYLTEALALEAIETLGLKWPSLDDIEGQVYV